MTDVRPNSGVVAPRSILPQQSADDAKRQEERAKARRMRERLDRFKPLLFIVVTLASWWFIILLANVTITCVPGGLPCGAPGPLIPSLTMSRAEWALVLIAVIAALWVAKMMVYPNRDFEDQ
jgi:hypothetical protein